MAHLFELPGVEYIGEIGDADKPAFLATARALLFPIDWEEPFGMVMIEAMACGTPVVAFRRGSVPEVLEDGVTGYLVDTTEEAIAAVSRLDLLDRGRCRAEFDRRFTRRTDGARLPGRLPRHPRRSSRSRRLKRQNGVGSLFSVNSEKTPDPFLPGGEPLNRRSTPTRSPSSPARTRTSPIGC